MVASGALVKERGLKPLARVLGYASAGLEPSHMGLGPARAIPKLMQLSADDLRRKLFDYRKRESWLNGRIDPADDNSWYRAWTETAAVNQRRGDAALAAGNLGTARSNWLRAIGYYQAAAAPSLGTPRYGKLVRKGSLLLAGVSPWVTTLTAASYSGVPWPCLWPA